MKSKIGYRETSSAMIIFSLAPSVALLVGTNSVHLGSGAVLNCALCFLISIILLFSLKLYLKKFHSLCITDALAQSFGTLVSWMISLIFVLQVFFLAVFCVSYLSKNIFSLVSGNFETDHIRLMF